MSSLALLGGAPVRRTPFHRWPHWDEREEAALKQVLADGSWGGFPSPNKRAKAFAEQFARYCGARYGVCAANGSVTLELCLQAMDLPRGAEVIVPAYTFVATAAAVAWSGGVPVFVDVDPRTYCMDPLQVEEAITERTRAIIPVHLACNMADMDAIMTIAGRRGLTVIEDCAHAHGARWRGRGAGSIGHFGSFSFQTTKLLTAGEGGIVLTSDATHEMKLQSLVNCGRKEPGYDAYEGRLLGHNYRISEWQAAVLSVQLERLDEQTERRSARARLLEEKLRGLPGISFTEHDPRNDRRGTYQLIVKYDPEGFGGAPRDRFLEALKAEGIPCSGKFYEPLHRAPLFPTESIPYRTLPCPVSERAAYEEAIWLPHPIFLGDEGDVEDVVRAFVKIQAHAKDLLA